MFLDRLGEDCGIVVVVVVDQDRVCAGSFEGIFEGGIRSGDEDHDGLKARLGTQSREFLEVGAVALRPRSRMH